MEEITGSSFAPPQRLPGAEDYVTFGTEWNAWRSSVMAQPVRRFRRPPQRPGVRDLSLMATQYPVGVSGEGFTSGRVTLSHVTSVEWGELTRAALGAGRVIPRLAGPTPARTGGAVEGGRG